MIMLCNQCRGVPSTMSALPKRIKKRCPAKHTAGAVAGVRRKEAASGRRLLCQARAMLLSVSSRRQVRPVSNVYPGLNATTIVLTLGQSAGNSQFVTRHARHGSR